METQGFSFSFAVMFEKWTKKAAAKATDGAVAGVTETLNEKLETYSGIIKIGLTLAIIIFGSKKITDHTPEQPKLPQGTGRYSDRQQPIIINNYISDGRYAPHGQKQSYQKH